MALGLEQRMYFWMGHCLWWRPIIPCIYAHLVGSSFSQDTEIKTNKYFIISQECKLKNYGYGIIHAEHADDKFVADVEDLMLRESVIVKL
jgi:hypothetical protein